MVMEIVNDVLSMTQRAICAKVKRDDVLHALAVHFSLEELQQAFCILSDWIGWEAYREDVVQNLRFHSSSSSSPSPRYSKGRKNHILSSPQFTPQCHPDIEIRKYIFDMLNGEIVESDDDSDSNRIKVAEYRDSKPSMKDRVKPASTVQEDWVARPGSIVQEDWRVKPGIAVQEDWMVNPGGIGEDRVVKPGSTGEEDRVVKPGSTGEEDRVVKAGNTGEELSKVVPVTRLENSPESCLQNLIDYLNNFLLPSPDTLNIKLLKKNLASTCIPVASEKNSQVRYEVCESPSTIESLSSDKYDCLDQQQQFVLESKGISIPLVTLKIWELMRNYFIRLPVFASTKLSFGSCLSVKLIHDEITRVNTRVEQLYLRLRWLLPVLNEQYRAVCDHDFSVDFTFEEDIQQLKSWLVKINNACAVEGFLDFFPNICPEAKLDSPTDLDFSRESSFTTTEVYDKDLEDSCKHMKYSDTRRSDKDGNLESFPDTITDDLLCWLWQAVKSDMDEKLTVHLVVSHYSLQEVHHSRNILTSYNFSLSYMKGVQGIVSEMFWVLRSVADNSTCKYLPRIVGCNVNNRPSVRPIKWTNVVEDLQMLETTVLDITTKICWLLPEARRYSAAMKAAGRGTLAPHLSAITDTLNRLKLILDWELCTTQSTPGMPHVGTAQPQNTYYQETGDMTHASVLRSGETRSDEGWPAGEKISGCWIGASVGASKMLLPMNST